MEDYRLLKSAILLIVVTLVTPVVANAYAVSTHKNLTENIINEYKRLNGREFTSVEKAMIMKASKEEDKLPRPLNHFYDPVHNKGLKGKYPASIQWAQNPYTQASQHKWFYSKDKKLFDGEDDYSWQRAVYEYTHGDKERGLESLGHVLHLVEDLTSVPHTRDDAHSGSWLDGSSYYEDYTAGLRPSVNVSKTLKANNIEEIMRGTALYTNNNFLSADTIFLEYAKPKIDELVKSGRYLHRGDLIVARVHDVRDLKTGKIKKRIFYITDKYNNEKVMQSYWEHLSYKAVESGVALMDLFFREVEQERKTGELAKMNKSISDVNSIAKTIRRFKATKFLLGSSLTATEAYELNKEEWDGARSAAKFYGIDFPPRPIGVKVPDRVKQAQISVAFKILSQNSMYKQDIKSRELFKVKDKESDVLSDSDNRENIIDLNARNIHQISSALVALESLMNDLRDTFKKNNKTEEDKCKDKDMTIMRYATCLSPFEEGGFAFGGGGAGAVLEPDTECVPAPSNGWCGAGPPGGPGAWTFN